MIGAAAVPFQADARMITAGKAFLYSSVTELRRAGATVVDAEDEIIDRLWRVMVRTFVALTELELGGLTVGPGKEVDGQMIYPVSGSGPERFGFMPTHADEGTWWLTTNHSVSGIGTASLILRATRSTEAKTQEAPLQP